MLKTVAVSANAKTGPIAVTYRSGEKSIFGTCPKTCGLHAEACSTEIDKVYLEAVYNAVPKGGLAWAYSHFPARVLPRPMPGKTTFNASCDTTRAAAAAIRRGRPAVYAAPLGTQWPAIHHGVQFVRCPAELSESFSCNDCGNGSPLCSRARDYVIVFVAHGSQKAKVGKGGGCYGANGNVAIQWRNTQKTGFKNDAEAITQFAAKLPVGSKLRHHIVGDTGKES